MATDELTALMERLENSLNPNLRRIGQLCRETAEDRVRLEAAMGDLRQLLDDRALALSLTEESYESQLSVIRDESERLKAERDEARRERDEFGEHNSKVNEQLEGFIKSPRLNAFDDHRDALQNVAEAALALARATGDAKAEREALEARRAIDRMAELSWQRDRAADFVDELQQSLLAAAN